MPAGLGDVRTPNGARDRCARTIEKKECRGLSDE